MDNSYIPSIAFKTIDKLYLNDTICKHLNESGCFYVGDLMNSSFSEIGGIHGIGVKRLIKIQTRMKVFNVTLESPISDWELLRPKK